MDDIERLWNEELMCGLIAALVDYKHNKVTLFLPDRHCTNMNGAISFCKVLLPNVMRIDVKSGLRDDFSYAILDNEWAACTFAYASEDEDE